MPSAFMDSTCRRMAPSAVVETLVVVENGTTIPLCILPFIFRRAPSTSTDTSVSGDPS